MIGRRPSQSTFSEVNNAVKRPNSSRTHQPTTESTQDTEETPGGAGGGQQQRVDRVVVVERPRRLVCRWFMMQSRTKVNADANANANANDNATGSDGK